MEGKGGGRDGDFVASLKRGRVYGLGIE